MHLITRLDVLATVHVGFTLQNLRTFSQSTFTIAACLLALKYFQKLQQKYELNIFPKEGYERNTLYTNYMVKLSVHIAFTTSVQFHGVPFSWSVQEIGHSKKSILLAELF